MILEAILVREPPTIINILSILQDCHIIKGCEPLALLKAAAPMVLSPNKQEFVQGLEKALRGDANPTPLQSPKAPSTILVHT